jgi:hypothetical protein
MKFGAVSRHLVRGMGWSLWATAKSVGSVNCECSAGVDDRESRVCDRKIALRSWANWRDDTVSFSLGKR